MFDGITGLMIKGIGETLYMTLASTFLAYVIGLPIGVVLTITAPGGIQPNKGVFTALGVVVNTVRSAPFIILLLALTPVTRFVTGTSLGATAMLVPLTIGAAPFIGRMVESSLNEVDSGVVEAAQSMGASTWQIVTRVLIAEAKPSLISGAAIAVTTILGYTAMAGMVGGGGLGAVAINYGYYRYQSGIMLVTLAIMVLIVQGFQETGTRVSVITDKRRR